MNTSSPVTAQPSSRRNTIIVFSIAVFFYWVALYLYVPTLPTYVQSKTDSLAMVGTVLSMYGLWQALVRLPLGIVSDWVGRRKVFIIAGFCVTALGAYVMGSASQVNGLLIGRALTGLAAGTWVPLVAAFSALFPTEEAVRASTLLTLIGSVGRMLATGVTGSLNTFGGYSLAFFLAAAAAIAAATVILTTHEARRAPKPPALTTFVRLVSRRDVLLPSALSLVGQYANWGASFGFLPILARQFGATDVQLSMLTTLNIAMLVLGNLTATTIVKRIGARNLVYTSFLLLFLGVGGAALARSLALVYVAQVGIGLCQGIGYPVLMGMSIQHVTDEQRTTAMGLHQAVYAIGMFAGPWLSGILAAQWGLRPMFGVTAVVCLLLGATGTHWLDGRRR